MSDETKLSEEEIGELQKAIPMAEEQKLLPCAHCGEDKALGIREAPSGYHPHWWQVYCGVCSIQTERIISREGAIAAWNRRPSPGRAEIRREALEEAARVAERAIAAGERVRDQMAPQSPIDGLENSLHAIVITTARGIARNIRALLPPPGGEGSGAQGDE